MLLAKEYRKLILEESSQDVCGMSYCRYCVSQNSICAKSAAKNSNWLACDISNVLGADNRYSLYQLKVHTGSIENSENTWIARL
jgi:hypothetical protein